MRLSSGDHAGRASARTRHRKWLRSGLAAVLSMATLAALAAPASATDTMPWGGQYADTSHPEQSAGANQPYQHGYTGLDILNWNPDADKDSEYLRSRVPLQTRIAANAATQKDPNLPADTEMFNLAGDYGNAFFESSTTTTCSRSTCSTTGSTRIITVPGMVSRLRTCQRASTTRRPSLTGLRNGLSSVR